MTTVDSTPAVTFRDALSDAVRYWEPRRLIYNAALMLVAYCAAYIPDIALQHTSFRGLWLKIRWAVLIVGTLMACALAYLFVAGMFGLVDGNW